MVIPAEELFPIPPGGLVFVFDVGKVRLKSLTFLPSEVISFP